MVIALFVGGIFLGFSLGIATMALLDANGPSFHREEAEGRGDACVCSPIRRMSPVQWAGPQNSGASFIPGP
jgi:hypothetical protein